MSDVPAVDVAPGVHGRSIVGTGAGQAAVELRAGSVHRFVYLVRGALQLTSASGVEQIGSGTLVRVPAGASISIQSTGPEMAAVAEFIPSRSEK